MILTKINSYQQIEVKKLEIKKLKLELKKLKGGEQSPLQVNSITAKMLNQLMNVALIILIVVCFILFIKNRQLDLEKKKLERELKNEQRKQNK